MFRFFSKLRRQLLAQKKITRYLSYAFGELALVVIGILIALQINTWNNERLQVNKEYEYLEEIKQNLEQDTLSLKQAIDFYTRKAELVEETFALFELGNKGKPYIQGLLPKMDTLTSFEVFVPVRTAFDNMVASETIDLIQVKDLRSALSQYYSQLDFQFGTQERAKQATRMFTDILGPRMMSKEIIQLYLNVDVAYPSVSEIQIHKDTQVASILFTLYMNATIFAVELEATKKEAAAIIGLIEQQLPER